MTPARFFDTPLPLDRAPDVLAIVDQTPQQRIISRYLADVTELRYEDCNGDQRIERFYRETLQTISRTLRSWGVERLEF
ncbi:MAG: hypothetical protein KDB00_22975 [Planctomycetales bacterium]|nr:hypothetical protein [Planctomycetales bacterium]